MYMVKITEDKLGTLTENIEKGLRYIGKAMQCLDEMGRESDYGERAGYGMGHREGANYRYPVDDDMEMRYGERDDMGMGYRRSRDSRGRYM